MEEPKYNPQIDKAQGMVIGEHNVINYYMAHTRTTSRATSRAASAWNIPFQHNRFFIGRDELLEQLHRCLGTKQAYALSGLGGSGKTQAAIEYAHRYRETYPFVLWIRSETRETLITDLVTAAGQLLLPERDNPDQLKVVAALKRWLETHEGWLLIFDSADDPSLLHDLLPTSGKGHLLLTTRAANPRPVAEPLEMAQLDEALGALFLLRRARPQLFYQRLEDAPLGDQQAARQLCRLMGGLPLALDQAGAYIDGTQCSLQDYVAFYQKDLNARLRLLQHRGIASGHADPVVTTWTLAFTKVEQANQAAADLLRACVFLAPDAIPEDLLRAQAGQWSKPLATIAGNPFLWNEAVAELLKYSLVRRNSADQALSIHRLVQDVLKEAMDEPTQRRWIEGTILALSSAFPEETEPATWLICKRLLPHAQACAELVKHDEFATKTAADLFSRTAWYLCDHARYSEAEPLYLRARAIYEQVLGPDHPQTANTINNLANLYAEQSTFAQAEPLYQLALAIRQRVLGPEHPATAASLNNLGLLCAEQGKAAQAEQLYQRTLVIYERVAGPGDPELATSLNNLANLYAGQGKFAQAEPLCQRALAMRERLLGPDHPETAASLNSLAHLYETQGKSPQAEPLYLRALTICEQVLGSEHPATATSLNTLALLYYKLGKYAEAEPLYQRALALRADVFGLDHPETAVSLNNLANLYFGQGKYAEAEPLYQSALAIYEQAFGPDHPESAESLHNLAQLYYKQKRSAEAQPLYLRALSIRERLLDPGQPETAFNLKDYAHVLRATNRKNEVRVLKARLQKRQV